MDRTPAQTWRTASDKAKAHDERQARRERVMRHPDLVARLAQVMDPAAWTGYIPPRTDPDPACRTCTADGVPCTHRTARANRSWQRRELVDICAEALRRETQPTFDELPLAEDPTP